MKVTVRDVERPDDDIMDWPYAPHLGLPFPGTSTPTWPATGGT
jgi:hypothetical protein